MCTAVRLSTVDITLGYSVINQKILPSVHL